MLKFFDMLFRELNSESINFFNFSLDSGKVFLFLKKDGFLFGVTGNF